LLSGNARGVFQEMFNNIAKDWQASGVSAHNNVDEVRLGTGGLSASNNSQLDKIAPQKEPVKFDPQVPTRRT